MPTVAFHSLSTAPIIYTKFFRLCHLIMRTNYHLLSLKIVGSTIRTLQNQPENQSKGFIKVFQFIKSPNFRLYNAKKRATSSWQKLAFCGKKIFSLRTFINLFPINSDCRKNRSDVKNKIPYSHWISIKNIFAVFGVDVCMSPGEETRNLISIVLAINFRFLSWVHFYRVMLLIYFYWKIIIAIEMFAAVNCCRGLENEK